jgi:hypothetical protein
VSNVTEIIVLSDISNRDAKGLTSLGAYIKDKHQEEFLQLNREFPGWRIFFSGVYLCAVNGLDHTEFLRTFIATVQLGEWPNPAGVQLLLKGEHDEAFEVHMVSAGAR